ncbi:MAG: GIY-YIG nuclease family protein [Pseudanabaenaceae cyanobacterium]
MYYYQDSLFPSQTLQEPSSSYAPSMSLTMLSNWQKRINNFQQALKLNDPQPDPFQLNCYPLEFYRLTSAKTDPCIYFILDLSAQIILYIGETQKANQRWQGRHDCKRYLNNYLSIHQLHQIPLQIHCSFWWQTSSTKTDRQYLEAQLIHYWKPPFNKENWQLWQTPFIN